MDKKKKVGKALILIAVFSVLAFNPVVAQNQLLFRSYDYTASSDTISLYFNLIDDEGQQIKNLDANTLGLHLQFFEDGSPINNGSFTNAKNTIRIPREQTISILIDQGIERSGKEEILEIVRNLVCSAPDSCIYLSFFGKDVTHTEMVTSDNIKSFEQVFNSEQASQRFFNSALYTKLKEFDPDNMPQQTNCDINKALYNRVKTYPDKYCTMFVFVDGSEADDSNDAIQYNTLTQDACKLRIKPTIYAFYYEKNVPADDNVKALLGGICGQSADMQFPKGELFSNKNRDEIFNRIGETVENLKYDYAFIYKAPHGRNYQGAVTFSATWDGTPNAKEVIYSIGTPENPWPPQFELNTNEIILKWCIALLAAVLTIAFFFFIMKILIPFINGKTFEIKYYKKYEPEYGINKRICTYCKQPILVGQPIVAKCEHIMHVHCWKQNDYRCAEYGQNCKSGIQEHINWKDILSKSSFRDCHQAISGVCAGFISWIFYELIGRGIGQKTIAPWIVRNFLTDAQNNEPLISLTIDKVSSFLAIGILLGFFMSIIFRYNEDYRKKNITIYMKILGLSLLSSLIGWLAFAIGGIMLCMMLDPSVTVIPWYASLPAYILFSVCASLSLTIKTSIPIRSAMLGGLCSAVIGFLVLYFSNNASNSHSWMNMLLDLIIYGGGLGASLVTVRMLAEKYFLVIQNGPKAGTRIPIHKWMNAIGGSNKVSIGMTEECEIQLNWEKSNKVAKEHAVLYVDQNKSVPMIKPLATGVVYNSRADLPVKRPAPLMNGDTFKIGDTIFLYEETD